jgi:putative addiction module component (TIGR02574 family)
MLSTEKLTNELLQLPARERAEIAYALMRSLSDGDDDDVDAEAAWDIELEQRWEELESRRVQGRPFDEATMLRGRYA